MMIVFNVLLCLATLLNSIESSSQSEGLPDGVHYTASSQNPVQPTARAEGMSPTLRQAFPSVLGFRFEDLALIRLRPHYNPNRIFELRRYVFPPDKPIRLRRNKLGQSAMPTGEQIVLSTSNGDVCAILDKKSHKHTVLRAICTLSPGQQNRAKINMNSGKVEAMTEEEIEECPVSTQYHVAKNYAVLRLGSPYSFSPRSSSPGSSSKPAKQLSRDRSESPHSKRTFPTVLGFKYDDLPYIRLASHNDPNRIFKLCIYIFPVDEPIGLRTRNGLMNPMPTGDQIVLLSSNNEVCAILLKSPSRAWILRPIFTSILGISKRVKIIMSSGSVEGMSTKEITECPASCGGPVTMVYRIFRV